MSGGSEGVDPGGVKVLIRWQRTKESRKERSLKLEQGLMMLDTRSSRDLICS